MRETSQNLRHTIDLITNLTNEVPGLVFQYRLGVDGSATVPYASDGINDIYELTPADVAQSAQAIEARIDPRDVAAYRHSLMHSLMHSAAIGVDSLRATDAGAYQALSRCDKALYVAKERGRNRIEVFEAGTMLAE